MTSRVGGVKRDPEKICPNWLPCPTECPETRMNAGSPGVWHDVKFSFCPPLKAVRRLLDALRASFSAAFFRSWMHFGLFPGPVFRSRAVFFGPSGRFALVLGRLTTSSSLSRHADVWILARFRRFDRNARSSPCQGPSLSGLARMARSHPHPHPHPHSHPHSHSCGPGLSAPSDEACWLADLRPACGPAFRRIRLDRCALARTPLYPERPFLYREAFGRPCHEGRFSAVYRVGWREALPAAGDVAFGG